jgi:hypothetical protein
VTQGGAGVFLPLLILLVLAILILVIWVSQNSELRRQRMKIVSIQILVLLVSVLSMKYGFAYFKDAGLIVGASTLILMLLNPVIFRRRHEV